MGGTESPDDPMQTQQAWNATCRALAALAALAFQDTDPDRYAESP
ncbi:hypothetical protein ACFV4T_03880 [Streptomyces sp. NPDC059755]